MMTALAGIVLALVAYGVVELVMNAVVDPGIDIDKALPEPKRRTPVRNGDTMLERTSGKEEEDMREHEVPTHVQAEDKVLLEFTFPQIVAVTAVCAISYGAYRYAPVGPSEVRMALAVVLGLVGVAMVVGKIGGRRLPLVAADLLEVPAGGRGVYAGPVVPAGAGRDRPLPAQPGEERPRPPEPDGETRRARAGKAAQEQEDPQEQGAPQRAYALVRQAQGQGRRGTPTARTTGPRPWGRGIGSPAWAGFRSWPWPS